MASLFEDFKKCIVWRKYGESWSGTFSIATKEGRKKFDCSISAMPNQAARFAKPEIAQGLFTRISEHCTLHGLNLNEIVKQKLVLKQKKLATVDKK